MDAPLYPPSAAFTQPVILPRTLDTTSISIADLLAVPAARDILLKEIAGFQQRIGSPQLKPHLGNFSPRSLVQFGVFKGEDLDRVDRQLQALPPSTGGAQ